jgi:hypothetical protein
MWTSLKNVRFGDEGWTGVQAGRCGDPGGLLSWRAGQRMENSMNARVFAAINDQINSEFQSAYTYLAMSGFCDRLKFLGAAKWLRMQSEEERQHAMKLFDFVLARGWGQVELKALAQPTVTFRVAAGGVRADVGARAGRHRADQRALRALLSPRKPSPR